MTALLVLNEVAGSEPHLDQAVGFSSDFLENGDLKTCFTASSEGQDRLLACPVLPTAFQSKFGER